MRTYYTYLEGAGIRYYRDLEEAWRSCIDQEIDHSLIGNGPDHPQGADDFHIILSEDWY
jgi:hypothetical protein